MSRFVKATVAVLSVVLCVYTLVEVNFNFLQTQSARAVFVGLGLCLCFLTQPLHPKLAGKLAWLDVVLAVLSLACCGYIVTQLEPALKGLWLGGRDLGSRAGMELATLDFTIGIVGLLLVLEAARRSIGWIVPILAVIFLAHTYYCYLAVQHGLPQLPKFLLRHPGDSAANLVNSTFIKPNGVFGDATYVMFQYVFLFAVFGCFLEMTGAIEFIIRFAERLFGKSRGGPAKVAVLGSGLMGSLSGSAVANAMTTGMFTIPMMKRAGFKPDVAGGITAAAASGGALVPPVMGAGAYMMMQFCKRGEGAAAKPVTFGEIATAAIIPAVLYYLSLLLIVHFYSRRANTEPATPEETAVRGPVPVFEGIVFVAALGMLITMLAVGSSPNLSVTAALATIMLLAVFRPTLPLSTSARLMGLLVFAAGCGVALGINIAYGYMDFSVGTFTTSLQNAMKCAIIAMLGMLGFGLIHPEWRPAIRKALESAAKQGVPLVAASACVGIIIAILNSGVANIMAEAIRNLVQHSLILTLLGIMFCSLLLGMGVPSVVCYLLLATLMGSVLTSLGIDPLAAHMFIFYFGLMSMVTPPVALAAYASASIAKAPIMKTAWESFKFSLVGFTLPFMFVYRPELLLLDLPEHPLTWSGAIWAITLAVVGIFALAVGLAGYLRGPLLVPIRIGMLLAAAALLSPDIVIGKYDFGLPVNITSLALVVAFTLFNWIRVGQTQAKATATGPPI